MTLSCREAARAAQAEDHDVVNSGEALNLRRIVHCALARLGFDAATLPPGATCGDPPAEAKLAVSGVSVARPDRDNGLQVDWKELSSQPFFGFNPSRAHGPKPVAAVPLDATPEFDRQHMFAPANSSGAAADASALLDVLNVCVATVASSPWVHGVIARTLSEFASVKGEHGGLRAGFRVALPTAAQLDSRCLLNCFTSSHRRRDIVLSQGFQTYGNGIFVTNPSGKMTRLAFHMPFLLNISLPTLAEHYGDVFVALQVRR